MQGINIFSGSPGLGAALTNPTELAFRKGTLTERYPLVFANRRWPDVETAYLTLKSGALAADDELMAQLIAAKLRQYPALYDAIVERGGLEFLAACRHETGARTERFRSWEGSGTQSRFIRNLMAGFRQVGTPSLGQYGQQELL